MADKRSEFGGWKTHKTKATGFFRISKQGQKWWLIDPQGNLFLSVGMNSVEPKRINATDNEKWARETYSLLNETGFNHRWVPDSKQTADWLKWSERPFLVGEFYAMKISNKRTNDPKEVAGFRVLEHEDAGEFYHTFSGALLREHPNCVGWHWFKYADDSDNYQKGIVGRSGRVHQPLVDAMKILNDQAYSLRGAR